MSNNSSTTLTIANAVSISLEGVSTIACIIALVVLLYYKMWRTFIYRLVLYSLLSLIVRSLSMIMLKSFYLLIVDEEMVWYQGINYWTNKTGLYAAIVIPIIFMYSSLALAFMLMTCITVSIYLMALHNYQFTYKSDLCLLIPSILYLMIVIILLAVSIPPNLYYYMYHDIMIATLVLVCLPFPINIVFTALTLVPLCCRACGYNLCMKTAATIESHRKALREILPLFILIVPSFLHILLYLKWLVVEVNYDYVVLALYSILGLLSALSFAMHLCFVRKNLKKLRNKKKPTKSVNLRCTHHTTAYTSEGISETCNTECPLLSENEEDTRFLLKKNNRVQ